MNKFAILGFPRSATKLLASIYEDQGYFNFGEFFDTFSSEVSGEIPYAHRKKVDDQHKFREQRNSSMLATNYIQHLETKRRIELFTEYSDRKSIVTVWPESFELAPELFEILSDRHFLCTRRSNKFEHLMSRVVTHYNLNYNGETESVPVTVEPRIFELFYFNLKKVENLQDYLVKIRRGTIIDFDKLTSGKADLGFEYSVNTIDQHPTLDHLILNLDEIYTKFNKLNSLPLPI